MKLIQDTELKEFIVIAPGVLTTEQCQLILATAKGSPDWLASGQGSNTTSPKLRNCDTLDISGLARDNPAWQELDQVIYRAVETAVRTYRVKHKLVEVAADTGYELLRYNTGTECREHVDSYDLRPRVISCSIALNNDYEGGEFTFFDGEVRHRVPAGSAIVFPSNFMYTHAVAPITQGTRYSVITWLV